MIRVLRKLYGEKVERLSARADPVVTIAEVREEYRTITGKELALGVSQYKDLLTRLRAMGLVDPLDGRIIDVRNGDARLRLRDSVRVLLAVQTLV